MEVILTLVAAPVPPECSDQDAKELAASLRALAHSLLVGLRAIEREISPGSWIRPRRRRHPSLPPFPDRANSLETVGEILQAFQGTRAPYRADLYWEIGWIVDSPRSPIRRLRLGPIRGARFLVDDERHKLQKDADELSGGLEPLGDTDDLFAHPENTAKLGGQIEMTLIPRSALELSGRLRSA